MEVSTLVRMDVALRESDREGVVRLSVGGIFLFLDPDEAREMADELNALAHKADYPDDEEATVRGL